MKKQWIFSLTMAGLALLTSCNSDELIDVSSNNAIKFSSAFVDKTTRGEGGEEQNNSPEDGTNTDGDTNETAESTSDPSYTTNNLLSFNVYGWVANSSTSAKLFDNVVVSRESTNDDFTYEDTQYWIEGGSYTFSAIAGFSDDNGGTLTIDNDGVRAESPTIEDFVSDGETDLIYSDSGKKPIEGAVSGNEAVEFTFQHQLAKVKFSFWNKTASTAQIDAKVTDIKITNAIQSGTVALSSEQHKASWSNLSTDNTYELSFGDAGDGYIKKYVETVATEEEKVEEEKVEDQNTNSSTLAARRITRSDPSNGSEGSDGANATEGGDNGTTETQSPTACTAEKLVIPSDGKEFTVQFTTTIYQCDVEIATVTHEAKITPTFVAGYAYNFIAELDEDNIDPNGALEPIVFTATVEDWEDGADTTPLTSFTAASTEEDEEDEEEAGEQ